MRKDRSKPGQIKDETGGGQSESWQAGYGQGYTEALRRFRAIDREQGTQAALVWLAADLRGLYDPVDAA